MRRVGLHLGIAFLTFFCGVVADNLIKYIPRDCAPASLSVLQSANTPRFVAVSSLLDRDYHIYWYKTPSSDDDQEITLYGDFRSAQVTEEHFESNAAPARLIERGTKFDKNGHKIGKRGITDFEDYPAVRIFWTDGDTFWSVQAPTLELARAFEESDVVHSITMANKRTSR